jgi:hypothetical protein
LGGEQHDLGPDDVSIRRRIGTRTTLKLDSLVCAEIDDERAGSRHDFLLETEASIPLGDTQAK